MSSPAQLDVADVDADPHTLNAEFDLAALHRDVSRWVTAVCLVTFDLDMGQSMEYMYPPNRLTPDECANVCNMAFPDSNASQIGDQMFYFRLRTHRPSAGGGGEGGTNKKKKDAVRDEVDVVRTEQDGGFGGGGNDDDDGAEGAVPSLNFLNEQPLLFGYVYFRQRRDASIHRGYFQKSVVIVSPLPCMVLFSRLVSILGPLYFEHGAASLDVVLHMVASWPDPRPGAVLDLPLLGEVLRTQMPLFEPTDVCLSPFSPTHGSTSAHVLGVPPSGDGDEPVDLSQLLDSLQQSSPGWFQSVNLYENFGSMITNMWYLWELAITGEPVLVLGKSPRACSEAVLGITSLVAPLVYRGDYRPFFTVYDPDFKYYSQLHDMNPSLLPSVVLGVTNPFFLKALEKFPHIVVLGDGQPLSTGGADPEPGALVRLGPSSSASLSSASGSSSASSLAIPSSGGSSSPRVKPLVRSLPFNGNFLSVQSHGPHIVSRATPLLVPDKTILQRLVPAPPAGRGSSSSPVDAPARSQSAAGGPKQSSAELRPKGQRPRVSSEADCCDDEPGSADLHALPLPRVGLSRGRSSPQSTYAGAASSSASAPGSAVGSPSSSSSSASRVAPLPIPPSLWGSPGSPSGGDVSPVLAINNAVLRKYFTQMTQNFLAPFERFFRVDPAHLPSGQRELTPAAGARSSTGCGVWNPYLEAPSLPRFVEEEFLAEVGDGTVTAELPLGNRSGMLGGKSLRRSKLVQLYRRFFQSPHFYPWFHRERDRAQARLRSTVHEVIKRLARESNVAFPFFLDKATPAEAESMYRSAHSLLCRALSSARAVDEELCVALRSHLAVIRASVPVQLRKDLPAPL